VSDDQFWMTSKRDGQCAECEGHIEKGQRIVWDTIGYKAYCRNCGEMLLGPDRTHP
jgi:predicted SprT family Zn-dependent metalloprotease